MAKSSDDHAEFKKNDVDVITIETPFKGYFQIDDYTLRHKKYNGEWSQPMSREVFERGHVSAMLLFDPVKDTVVMVEQFRVGAYAAGYYPWLIEIPAGIIEKDQTPQDVAIRETFEETGCTAKRIEFIADYLVTQGGSSETMYLYCVEVDSDESLEFAGLDHEGEDIRVLKYSTNELFNMLETGQVHNSTGIIAIQWLKIHHDKLRNEWCS